MRIDQLMNKLCLVKSRSIAKKACDQDLILVNGKAVKASTEINEGDIIQYSLYGFLTTIKLQKIPTGNVSKKDAAQYYELISRDQIEPHS